MWRWRETTGWVEARFTCFHTSHLDMTSEELRTRHPGSLVLVWRAAYYGHVDESRGVRTTKINETVTERTTYVAES